MTGTAAAVVRDRPISRTVLAALFITATAVVALDDAFIVDDAARQMRFDGHTRILAHTATAPDRYRVLVPYLVEPLVRAIARFTPYPVAVDAAYAVFYVCGFVWLVWTLFLYLRAWFTEHQALIGALAAASTLHLTLQEYTPFSVIEPGIFAIGLLLAYRQRRGWLAVLVAIASLNRETAVFLPLAYAVTSPITKKTLTTTAALFAIWAVVVLGVRYAVGEGDRVWTLASIWVWNSNREHLWLTLQNATLLLGAFWVFAALGYRRSPPFVRRSVWIVPAYVATILVWGVWTEVRLLTPLYPVVFSLALSYLFRPSASGGPLPFERRIVIAAVLATAAGVNAYHYSFLVPRMAERIATHEAVVHHTAAAPERFRVLVPFVVETFARPASRLMPYEKAVTRLYAAYYLIGLTTVLAACFAYFSKWFTRETAMIGALIVADTVRIALRQGEYIRQLPIPSSAVFVPHSILEPTFIAAALVLVAARQWRWLAVIAGVAALNSEMALLVPLVALAGGRATNRTAAAISAGVVAGVLLLVRLIVGGPWTSTPLQTMWQLNIAHLPTAILNLLLLLGGAWILAAFGYRRSPAFLRRVAMIVPLYVAAVFVWGFWWDVRLLLSLYPLVMPLALACVS